LCTRLRRSNPSTPQKKLNSTPSTQPMVSTQPREHPQPDAGRPLLRPRSNHPAGKRGSNAIPSNTDACFTKLMQPKIKPHAPDSPLDQDASCLENSDDGHSSIDHLCFLSPLNPTTAHFHFLKSRHVSNQEVHKAIYCSAVYQSVMRSSIRDPENLNPKTIVVPERTAAEYLRRLLPRSLIPGQLADRMDCHHRT
jgi:hypothetical protein